LLITSVQPLISSTAYKPVDSAAGAAMSTGTQSLLIVPPPI
jgi:hypothetical protein